MATGYSRPSTYQPFFWVKNRQKTISAMTVQHVQLQIREALKVTPSPNPLGTIITAPKPWEVLNTP